MTYVPVTIIGGGAVGVAIAYELSKDLSDKLVVIDKNTRNLTNNQSTRNSGVVHAGLYYDKKIMPNKASFCVEGNRLMYEFAKEHDIPFSQVGKLVVANGLNDDRTLDYFLNIANQNNVPGIRTIDRAEAKEMEPNIECTSALYVPSSGVIDPISYVSRLSQLTESNQSYILKGTEVISITPKNKCFEVTTFSQGRIETFKTDVVINSAGLYSDDVARMINPDSPYNILPIRGESMKFYTHFPGQDNNSGIEMNGMSVYPAPYGISDDGQRLNVSYSEVLDLAAKAEANPTIGVHLTPMFDYVDGVPKIGKTVLVGPTFKVGVGKEDYQQVRLEDYYINLVKNFFPNLSADHISPLQTGIRAKLDGFSDFIIERDANHPNFVNLLGIDSPGLTSSLAIAKYVRDELLR